MTREELLALPFHDYMAYCTKYAVDIAQRTRLLDMDYVAIAMFQALWAREYWVHHNTAKGNAP